jgi:hypothetical protein
MIDESQMWDGPTPSPEEQNQNQNWMVDHLVKFPSSIPFVAVNFPHVANKARAIIRYNELEHLLRGGKITESDYQAELENILPLIDLQNDL